MSADYRRLLDRVLRVFMDVEFKTEGRNVLDYSVVLLVEEERLSRSPWKFVVAVG
jgi:hypothetical protein